jgi:hypothetical protein
MVLLLAGKTKVYHIVADIITMYAVLCDNDRSLSDAHDAKVALVSEHGQLFSGPAPTEGHCQ